MEVPTARSVGNQLVYMRLIYLFELKTLDVLYLPDHNAYTSTVYRPRGYNSSFGMILKKLAGFAMSVPVREWFAMPRLTSGGVYNSDFYCFPPAGKTCWPCWNATCSFLFFASDVVDLVATRYVAFYLAITLPKSSTRCNISFQR